MLTWPAICHFRNQWSGLVEIWRLHPALDLELGYVVDQYDTGGPYQDLVKFYMLYTNWLKTAFLICKMVRESPINTSGTPEISLVMGDIISYARIQS